MLDIMWNFNIIVLQIGSGYGNPVTFDASKQAHLRAVASCVETTKHLYLSPLPNDILLLPDDVLCCGKVSDKLC